MAELTRTSTVAPVAPVETTQSTSKSDSLDVNSAVAKVPLGFDSSGIGVFLGPKASLLKKFVLSPTRSEFPDAKFQVKVFTEEIGASQVVFAAIFLEGQMEALHPMMDRIKKHAFITEKKLSSKAREEKDAADGMSTFVIKTRMEHFRIAKFIGREGNNICKIVSKINDLPEVVGNRTNVNIQKERFVNRKNCFFYILDNDETTDEHVLITIKTITKNRKTTWNAILEAVKSAIKPRTDYNSDYLNSGPDVDFLGGFGGSSTSPFGSQPLETSNEPDSPSARPSSPSYNPNSEDDTIEGW